jgi:ketosteroid isomerase-like protein
VGSNLELVKSIYEEWEKGDFSSSAWADPEIELVVADGPTPGTSTGRGEMAARWAEVLRAYEDFRAIPERFQELDDERVLVYIRNRGRGKGSGLEVAEMQPRSVNLFHVREGKVVRLTAWWSRERGLADLGLADGIGSDA